MNGEIYLMSKLVTTIKKMLASDGKEEVFLTEPDYVKKIEIQFLRGEKYESSMSFAKALIEKGIVDIELYLPTEVNNRMNLGFANSSSVCMRVYYKDGDITGFLSDWSYDEILGGWKILYSEHNLTRLKMEGITKRISYKNNENEFINVLKKISVFAKEIGADSFGDIFDNTIKYLKESDEDNKLFKAALP